MGRNDSYNYQIYCNTNCISRTTTTTAFLPFLCRLSTKDAVKTSESSPCHKKNEPSSPRVGCMGQIKRHNTNQINSPTTAKLKYTHLKKMFSGRNLLISSTTNVSNNSTSCKNNKNKKIDRSTSVHRRPKFRNHGHGNCAVVVPLNMAELDPPLPVVKPPCSRRGEGSLWKRRGGAAPLEDLQIQQLQLPCNNTALPPSSVS